MFGPMKHPNILFIMADQCRWDALGCSGGWVRTPNLDRIAREGVRFTNCVTNSPVCIPARVSLAAGHYPHNTHVWNNIHYAMPAQTPTWMRAVRDAGYRTSLFGKTHLHPHKGDLREREHLLRAYGLEDIDEIGGPRASARVGSHMTERWEKAGLWAAYQDDYADRFATKPHVVRPSVLPLEHYADVYVGQQAKQYLAAYDRDEPFFCWVSFGGPHEPWDAPEPYAGMYDPADMPMPVPASESGHDRPRGQLDRLAGHRPTFEEGDVARMRANYAGNVTLIDDQIGEILDVLRDRGELDNTVIAFTSDHGEMNGDHGLIYKSNFFNGAIRVPMLVRTPETLAGAPAARICESPVEWFDLGPTLVELAGGALEHHQFGVSLCPALDDPARVLRDDAVSELGGEIMFIDTRWKIAVNTEGRPCMLFDLAADPDELHNVAGLPDSRDLERDLLLRLFQRLIRTQQHAP